MARIRLLVLFLLTTALLTASSAYSASSGIVVSQVYAGGGNAGASYTNDFVELFNPGTAAVDLGGWTLQYASAASTTWQATALSGSIPSGRYYLVQLASAATNGAALPTPDAVGTTNLAVSGGKVALVHATEALTCGASAGSCSAGGSVADRVGYGSATDNEGGSAPPALSSTTAASRADGGCADTDDNSADFTAATPAPRNTASAAHACVAAPPHPSTSQDAPVDIDIQAVLSISLERSSVSFGNAASGGTPAGVSEAVTVVSNNATGYALTVHRSAFSPADLPLGIAASSAPSGGLLGGGLGGGTRVPIPIAPAPDLLVGTTTAPSGGAGDVWPTSLGFTSALPTVAPGHYTATVTLTAIGR
jgi:predicted extracellular nuclease